jgi:DNA-binding NarL/FixJ family response regulator
LKRAPFLGASAAVLLSGCGGHHIMRALPGVAPSSTALNAGRPPNTSLRLVPESADPIPASVLTKPIIGEARRFDGAAAPSNWVAARGQTLKISENPVLYGILGTVAGGDGKTTFKLPNSEVPMIVAVAGQLMTSPAALAQARHVTARDSLGPGAIAAPPRPRRMPAAQTLREQRLIASAVRTGSARAVPLSAETEDRITRAEQRARGAALAALGPSSRARLDASVQAVASGRATIAEGIASLVPALSRQESDALVAISDALTREFNDRWAGNDGTQVQLDAAQFVFSLAITREQAHAASLLERRRRQ